MYPKVDYIAVNVDLKVSACRSDSLAMKLSWSVRSGVDWYWSSSLINSTTSWTSTKFDVPYRYCTLQFPSNRMDLVSCLRRPFSPPLNLSCIYTKASWVILYNSSYLIQFINLEEERCHSRMPCVEENQFTKKDKHEDIKHLIHTVGLFFSVISYMLLAWKDYLRDPQWNMTIVTPIITIRWQWIGNIHEKHQNEPQKE